MAEDLQVGIVPGIGEVTVCPKCLCLVVRYPEHAYMVHGVAVLIEERIDIEHESWVPASPTPITIPRRA